MNSSIQVISTSRLLCVTIFLATLVVDIVWMSSSSVGFDWSSTTIAISVPLALLIYGCYYTYIRPSERISSMSIDTALLIFFSHVGSVYGYLIATSPLPLQDELLVHIDSVLGFDWQSYSKFVFSSTILRYTSALFYYLTLPLVVFTLVWLSLSGKTQQSSEFILSIIVGAIVCITVSWFIPSAGAVGFYAPSESLYNGHPIYIDISYKQDYFDLRAGKEFIVSFVEPKGFVAFPSYHICMAILIVLAFRREKTMFWIMLTINSLTALSTPIDGGHHLTDVIGGALVGVFCFYISRYVQEKDNVRKMSKLIRSEIK